MKRGMWAWGAGLALAAAVAGCSGDKAPAEQPRIVLVMRPVGGPDAAVSVYAGEIRARNESPLAFRVGGNIAKRLVDVGEAVKQGQLLAELDPGDQRLQAGAAQAQLAAAEADLVRARGDLQRYKALADQQLVSRSAYDAQLAAFKAAQGQANAARAQSGVAGNQAAYTQLRAPRDGVIASRSAEAGQTVAAGQAVFTLAADGGREVAIALPESRIREFHAGQQVLVELWSAPDRRMPGAIREISPQADAQARTYAARVALAGDAARQVELGQSARVYVQGDAGQSVLRLPLSALQRDGKGGTSVWVVDPATHALRSVPVATGPFGEDSVPVLSGLQAGDWVVAAGGHLLRDGQKVAPVDRDNRPVATTTAPAPKAN